MKMEIVGKIALLALVVGGTLGSPLPPAIGQKLASEERATAPRLTAPKLFPEKTLAYVRVDDVATLKADMARSSIGRLSADDQLKPILSEFYGSLVRNTQEIQEAIGLNLDEVLSIPTGELAVALLPKKLGEVRSDQPAIAVLLDAGEEIGSVQVLLDRIESGSGANLEHTEKTVDRLTLHRFVDPNRPRRQLAYFIDDGVMVACTITEFLEEMAAAWISGNPEWDTLADQRKFVAIMSRCVGTEGERPHVSFYADPLEIARQVAPDNAGAQFALATLPALGLDGIEAVGGSWIVSPPDFDSISHMHLLLKNPRRELLGLIRPKSGSTTPESWVPESVAGYSTINWDLIATMQAVEKLYDTFRGGEGAMEEQVFERLKRRMDIDLRKDVLENLDGRITLMQGFVRPIRINSGSNVYAIKLKNARVFENEVLPKLLEQVPDRFPIEKIRFGKLNAQVLKVPSPRGRNSAETLRTPEICITFHDDYLIIADSAYMMRQIADCINGSELKLVDSLEFELISNRIKAQLQDKESSALSYARPQESLQLFYELARDPKNVERLRGIAEGNGFFTALLSALDKHKLPPFSVIQKYLAPGGGFLVEEQTGLHYMSFSLRRE